MGSQATYGIRGAIVSDLSLTTTQQLNDRGDIIVTKHEAPVDSYVVRTLKGGALAGQRIAYKNDVLDVDATLTIRELHIIWEKGRPIYELTLGEVDTFSLQRASRVQTAMRAVGTGLSTSRVDAEVLEDKVVTVKSAAGDYTTIQAAIDYFADGKALFGACRIDADAATYDEAVDFSSVLLAGGATLTLRGDQRLLAGLSYVAGAAVNQIGLTNGGSGTCLLTDAGDNITVTGTTTNPDFDADGWGSGDKILVYNDAGAIAEYTIDSVANNIITLTVAAPAVGNDATAIVLLPDRRIARSTAGPCISAPAVKGVGVDGFYLKSSTGADCHGVYCSSGGLIYVENCISYAEDMGFYAEFGFAALISNGGAVSAWGCTHGYLASDTGQIRVPYSVALGGTNGYYAQTLSLLTAFNTIAVNATRGYLAQVMGLIWAQDATARQNTTGYHGLTRAYMLAVATNANNNGNGTNYNPAVSDTFGNSNASITWS